MSAPEWPLVWVDETFGAGPLEPTPSAGASAGPVSPVGDVPPSRPPEATAADAAKAKLEAIYNDTGNPYWRGDPAACDEVLALTRIIYPDTQEPELEPVTLTDADRPSFQLPADVDADDPAIRALAETVAFAELPASVAQPALDRAFTLIQQDVTESAEELDAAGDKAIAAMQARFGSEYPARRTAMLQGKAILEAADPNFRTIFNHPLVANDPTVFIALSELGLRQRTYDVRRVGTSRAPRVG